MVKKSLSFITMLRFTPPLLSEKQFEVHVHVVQSVVQFQRAVQVRSTGIQEVTLLSPECMFFISFLTAEQSFSMGMSCCNRDSSACLADLSRQAHQ